MLSKISSRIKLLFCSHSIEPIFQPYSNYRKKQLKQYMDHPLSDSRIGSYSAKGATSFSQKHPQVLMKNMLSNKNSISSIGLGTYKGSLDSSDDILQFNSIIDSVLSGVNFIDTCSNFRGGRSQLIVGQALRYLIEHKKYQREQIMISTKGGYVRQQLPDNLSSEIVNEHCVHPTYLQHSLNKSLDNMKVKTVDIYFLNNFAQSQMNTIGKKLFEQKISKAFQFLEKMRSENKISSYGLASWESFRVSPKHPLHLNLNHINKIAENVGGKNHGFKFIQIPINVMMPQAFAQKNQQYGSLLQTAQHLKINVISCSPLLNGTLINIPLPTNKLSCRNNGAKHIQLIRSTPSPALVCTLIGHKTNRHTKKNLEVLRVPSLSEDQWFNLFVPRDQPNQISAKAAQQ